MNEIQVFTIIAVVLLALSLIYSNKVSADSVDLPNPAWGCGPFPGETPPPPTINKDKGYEPSGHEDKPDTLYLHLVDESGNDIQIWCLDHGDGGDYAIYVSAPNKDDTYISSCALKCGDNKFDLTATAGTTIENQTDGSDGNPITGNITGTMKLLIHTNWVPVGAKLPDNTPNNPDDNPPNSDAGKDIHTIYNFTSGEFEKERIATKINPTTGEHEIARVERMDFIPHETPNQLITLAEREFIKKSFQDFVGLTGMGTIVETVPEIHRIHSTAVVSQGFTHTVYSSSGSDFNKLVLLPDGNLSIKFSNIPHSEFVSMALPKNLIDHPKGEPFEILTDGKRVEVMETPSSTHNVISFNVEKNTLEVLIKNQEGIKNGERKTNELIPEFYISIAALVFVISIAVIFAFRPRLHHSV